MFYLMCYFNNHLFKKLGLVVGDGNGGWWVVVDGCGGRVVVAGGGW